MNRIPSLCGALSALALGACATRPPAPSGAVATPVSSSPVVARIGAQSITLAELDRAAAAELYEVRQKALDGMIVDRVRARERRSL